MIEQILIKNEPYLRGDPDEKFKEESHFGLQVGDLITQVGRSGQITSSNRRDEYKSPIRYCGTGIYPINKPETALVFALPFDAVGGLEPGKCIYKLYFLCGKDIIVPGFDTGKYKNHIRIYKPIFKKVKPMTEIFDEKALRTSIANIWGEAGAHIEVYDRLINIKESHRQRKPSETPETTETRAGMRKSKRILLYMEHPEYKDVDIRLGNYIETKQKDNTWKGSFIYLDDAGTTVEPEHLVCWGHPNFPPVKAETGS